MSKASDSSKLHFTTFPEDMLGWVPWFYQQYTGDSVDSCTLRVKNDDNKSGKKFVCLLVSNGLSLVYHQKHVVS
jgi:hypothetical protein